MKRTGTVPAIALPRRRLVELFEVDHWYEILARQVLEKRHPLKRRIMHRILVDIVVQVTERASVDLTNLLRVVARLKWVDRAKLGNGEVVREGIRVKLLSISILYGRGTRTSETETIPVLCSHLLRVNQGGSIEVKSAAFDTD